MSIASAIQATQQKIANAYTAISNKGGTLPATQDLANMPTAINSISTANLTSLSVTPSTTAQALVPSSPYSGFNQVDVSAVTSSIDANITAGNIKKDVQILGVTGTYEGSSGGGSTTGEFLVQVIDYDGTVLKSERLDKGATFTLPSQPSHTGLVFQSWSSPVTITNNTVTVTDQDITIGTTYTTTSGLSEFDITLTEVTGLSVTLNMDGTKNWGDGASDTNTTHTYASAGDYTITCNGSTMTTSRSSGLFGQISSVKNYYVKDIRLGSSVTSISNYAFSNCHSLTSITIPSSITSIGSNAFQYCSSLASITIPSGVTSIGSSVFISCFSLISITIPSSVTSIGSSSFSNCYSLTSITIPSSVTNISDTTFNGCSSLTRITIPEGVTSIGNNAFNGCSSLTRITIPEGVTSIGGSSFSGCYTLTRITIPSSVTSIGSSVFISCYSLTSITISSGVTSIGGSSFSNCYSLTSITIPSSVTSISNNAFSNCYSILEYDFSSHTAVPTLSGTNAFNNINKICKIKVPASLESQWKSASNWSTYADYIVGV